MLETASCVKGNHEPIDPVPCRQRDFQSFASGAAIRRLCSARPLLHRWLEPDCYEGSAIADGLLDEVRQPTPGHYS
jgi:hypothetical protein